MSQSEDQISFEEYEDQVAHLPVDVLISELKDRKLRTDGTIKRRIDRLVTQLVEEQVLGPIDFVLPDNLDDELDGCIRQLEKIREHFENSPHTEDVIENCVVRLEFMHSRLGRMDKRAESEDKMKIKKVFAKHREVNSIISSATIIRESRRRSLKDESGQHGVSFFNADPIKLLEPLQDLSVTEPESRDNLREIDHQASGASTHVLATDGLQRPKVPVWKWGLKFTGEAGSLSASEFVRRASDLMVSRNINKQELFLSAAEVFDGTALKWYRSVVASRTCNRWDDLTAKLISDFESADYKDNLLDFIRNRKQGRTERVVAFFAAIEDLFLKLNYELPMEERVRIIHKNILPEYIRATAILNFANVNVLKETCKRLESGELLAGKNSVNKRYENESARRNLTGIRSTSSIQSESDYNRERNQVEEQKVLGAQECRAYAAKIDGCFVWASFGR